MIGFLLTTRLGRAIGGAVVLVLAFTAWTAYQRHDAATDALREREAQIKEINDALSRDAMDARAGRVACVAAGGVWSFTRARCDNAE